VNCVVYCTEVEVAQKSAQDAKNQVKKLEQALEHEKQLKTEVNNPLQDCYRH